MIEIKEIKKDDVIIKYIEFGNGNKPLIIIPGVSVTSVLNSKEAIKNQYSLLIDKYKIYLFDRRTPLKEGDDCITYAMDCCYAMDYLNIKNACVFGASQGGMIGLVLASLRNDLVSKLFVASTLCKQNDISRNTFSNWVKLSNIDSLRELNHDIFGKVYSIEYYKKYERAFIALESTGTKEDVKRFKILAKACLSFDGTNYINNIKCPVKVISGQYDNVLDACGGKELANMLNVDFELIPNGSHAIYDEYPGFINIINDFFEK